jgi:hypothetical protein
MICKGIDILKLCEDEMCLGGIASAFVGIVVTLLFVVFIIRVYHSRQSMD